MLKNNSKSFIFDHINTTFNTVAELLDSFRQKGGINIVCTNLYFDDIEIEVFQCLMLCSLTLVFLAVFISRRKGN